MKINKLLFFLICLINLQISSFPVYFCKFITLEGKEIIIIGDLHKHINSDKNYVKTMNSLFTQKDKSDKQTIIHIEKTEFESKFFDNLYNLKIPGLSFDNLKDEDKDLMGQLNANQEVYNKVVFKKSDIRAESIIMLHNGLEQICNLNTQFPDEVSFDTRKYIYAQISNIS